MLKKPEQRQPLCWTALSIVFAWIGIAFYIVCLEKKSIIFCLGFQLFMVLALVFGVGAIVLIIRNIKLLGIYAIAQLLVLVLCGMLVLTSFVTLTENFRIRIATSDDMLMNIKEIGHVINEYKKESGYMPDANSWCNLLIKTDNRIQRNLQIIKIGDEECNFAFNKNLSNLPVDNLDGNIVLIFEADGDLNLSGGPELINKERAKDKYFLFKKHRFIYVLFVDGTIVKYRLHDGAIAKYDEDVDECGNYIKGKTKYSPLRWEP